MMNSFGLSVLTAAVLVLGSNTGALAQSAAEIQAGALLRTAERLDASSDDIDQLSPAYEAALEAYTELNDTQNSVEILRVLFDLNHQQCRDEQATIWAKRAIAQLSQPTSNLDLDRQIGSYGFWVRSLGQLYEDTDQISAAVALYGTGVNYMAARPQSIDGVLTLEAEAELLRRQLNLQIGGSEAERTQLRLLSVRQRAGAITQVDGLLNDARYLDSQGNPSLEILLSVLQLSRQNAYRAGELGAILLLGKQALREEAFSQASGYGRQAVAIATNLVDAETERTNALYVLAQAEQGDGNITAAIDHYTELLEILNSQPPFYVEASKTTVVRNLRDLYQQNNQVAAARALEQQYATLLSGRFPRTLRLNRPPRSLLRSRPIRRFSTSRLRRCDIPATRGVPLPSLRPSRITR